jgi:hypothetical protein
MSSHTQCATHCPHSLPFAVNFLFHPIHLPLAMPLHSPETAYNFAHSSADTAHTVRANSSLHITHHANTDWSLARPSVQFGRAHHTMTPQQWCFQALSLNIVHGLLTYLQTALATLSKQSRSPGLTLATCRLRLSMVLSRTDTPRMSLPPYLSPATRTPYVLITHHSFR